MSEETAGPRDRPSLTTKESYMLHAHLTFRVAAFTTHEAAAVRP